MPIIRVIIPYLQFRDRDTMRLLFRSRLWECDSQKTVIHLGLHFLGLYSSGKLNGARELAMTALADGISAFLARLAPVELSRDSQAILLHFDGDVFTLQSRKLKRRRNIVGLLVLMETHPWPEQSLLVYVGRRVPLGHSSQGLEASFKCVVEEAVELGKRIVVEAHKRGHFG